MAKKDDDTLDKDLTFPADPDKADPKVMPIKPESKPKPTTAESEPLQPVEDLAKEHGIKSWELAGPMRAAGWAAGKQVTKTRFQQALNAFRHRPQGGGRINI